MEQDATCFCTQVLLFLPQGQLQVLTLCWMDKTWSRTSLTFVTFVIGFICLRVYLQGRPGLLRTVLEAQETRGLTRSDDISRLLPSEAANMARGRRVRQSKLLFFAKVRPWRCLRAPNRLLLHACISSLLSWHRSLLA